ncbi:hypothetical protein AK812_SmicGene32310 [Symbiodinium microadriaticum]|uniref:Uncharacterized protein n=1 Tax=Symbiodinium microadriaticum TaxID=2951 RepID=A0A1Q9CUE6_SYMMI|nr:hypothetical protein AK812_SmicGene32310 [Symbiodinium microadriaticum]
MGCGALLASHSSADDRDLADLCVEGEKHSSSSSIQFSTQALRLCDASAAPANLSLSTAGAHHAPGGQREAASASVVRAGTSRSQRSQLGSDQLEPEPWDVDDLSYGPSFGPEELDADTLRRLTRSPASFVVGGILAKTDNCEVHLAAQISDRTKLVVKRVHRSRSAQPYPTHVNEIRCLDRLRHPCIVRLLGVIEEGDTLEILLEYCDLGALRNYVELGSPHIPSFLSVLCDVISALVFMHTEHFAHLDVKPHNILVKSEGAPWLKTLRGKLCDLGTATRIGASGCLRGLMGTPGYRAPEIDGGLEFNAYKADVWSLGKVAAFVEQCSGSSLKVGYDSLLHDDPRQRPSSRECGSFRKAKAPSKASLDPKPWHQAGAKKRRTRAGRSISGLPLSGPSARKGGMVAKSQLNKDSKANEVIPKFRLVMCWMLFGCRLVCQANRILFGALLPAIRQDLQLSDSEAGSLLSAFASGYMLTQILGGTLADRVGGKWILQLAICAVSMGSIVAPIALQQGFWATYCTYFLMGFLEGPSFPATGSMLSKWNKPGPESDDAPLNHLVVAQLSKTKLCSCNDASCRFAHSARELRMPPDLTKTAICRAFVRGDCQDPACKFAHGESYAISMLEDIARRATDADTLTAQRKPLSPGPGTPAESLSPGKGAGEHPRAAPAAVANRSPPDAHVQPHAPPGLERSETSLPSSPSVKDGRGMEGHHLPGQLFEDQSAPSPQGQGVEVPMKVPLPIRPMDRSPLLPRCGPGISPELAD